MSRRIVLDAGGVQVPLDLIFEPYQSLLVCVARDGGVHRVDIRYRPPEPVSSV
jgi:hypothetical protein